MSEHGTVPPEPASLTVSLAPPVTWSRVADYVALTKPRVNALVVVTAAGGFYLGSGRVVDAVLLTHTVVGTWLVAAAAAAFNQISERDADARMRRTRMRPLPDGRIQPAPALVFACVLAVAGLAQLAAFANPLAAVVALVTLISYTVVYTPLKRYTSLSTLVGGIPGGLPPVIGWAAAEHQVSAGAVVLFGIVFLWQMPHFLAIAWLCRDDYARAGFPMLPVLEPDGRSTATQSLLYASVLIPVSLLPAALGLAAGIYAAGALVFGVGFLALAASFARSRDKVTARRLFLGSVAYLPLLWALMMLDGPVH
jgi:protoheme IX farnesyltransferase